MKNVKEVKFPVYFFVYIKLYFCNTKVGSLLLVIYKNYHIFYETLIELCAKLLLNENNQSSWKKTPKNALK